MNGTETLDQRVEAYVESVGRALGELDPEDRAAILDDVREHAAAVLAEDPAVQLVDRLGTPQDFARDLLEAAGLVAVPQSRIGLRVRLARFKATRAGQTLVRAGQEFAPVFAVLRGVAAVWILSRFLGGDQVPHLALLLLLGGVAGWLLSAQYQELISSNGTAGRVLSVVADVATAIVAIAMAVVWATGLSPAPSGPPIADPWGQPTQDGTWVGAIQAYGPDGAPAPVALYDPEGSPLLADALSYLFCLEDDQTPVAVPYLNSAGRSMDNVFPLRGVCVDAFNVVVAEATAAWGEPAVQQWSTAGMPDVGQTVIINESGVLAGIASDPEGTPSPTGDPADPADPADAADPAAADAAPADPAAADLGAGDPVPGDPPASAE